MAVTKESVDRDIQAMCDMSIEAVGGTRALEAALRTQATCFHEFFSAIKTVLVNSEESGIAPMLPLTVSVQEAYNHCVMAQMLVIEMMKRDVLKLESSDDSNDSANDHTGIRLN